MGARAVEKQKTTKESSGLRKWASDEHAEVDEGELLDTAEVEALTAAEEARARAADRLRPSPQKPRPPSETAATLRVDATAGTKATVPTPDEQREELRALRRETLDRISAEKRSSRPDLSSEATDLPPVLAPRPAMPSEDQPDVTEPVARAEPLAGTSPRAQGPSTHDDGISEAKTLPLAKLRARRADAVEPATVPLKNIRGARMGSVASPEAVPAQVALPWARIVAVVAFAAVMFVVGRWVTRSGPDTSPRRTPDTASAPSQALLPKTLPPKEELPAPPPTALRPPPTEVAPRAAAPATRGDPSGTTPLPAPTTAAPALGGQPSQPAPTAEVSAAPASPTPATEPVATATDGLDSAAASTALARAGARAASCTDSKGGAGSVSVTFQPDGTAGHVTMSGPYEGTAVASCVARIFGATRVTPFRGAPATVFYTVRLPGDGKPIE